MNFVRVIKNLFQFNRTNWKAMLLCVIAAGVFWLFNAFNKTYSADLEFPLRFGYDKDRYVADSPLPSRIKINVSGLGWELFRKSMGLKLPELLVALERPIEQKKIIASTLTPILAGQLGGLQINYIITDTLNIRLDMVHKQDYYLKVNEESLALRKGFGISAPIKITPDRVELEGPMGMLKKIPDTIQINVPEKDLHKTYSDDVEVLLAGNEFIKRNPPLVNVQIEVVPVSLVEIKLSVKPVNAPAGYKPAYTETINSSWIVPADKAEEFKARMQAHEAIIDLSKLLKGSNELKPMVTGLPGYARIHSIDSIVLKF
jgi:hypothetical protein